MKTRIISGAIMILLAAGIITLGKLVSPLFLILFVAVLAGMAVYELVHNAAGVKSKGAVTVSVIYGGLMVVAINIWSILGQLNIHFTISLLGKFERTLFLLTGNLTYILTVLYVIFAVVVILKQHKNFDLGKIAVFSAMPILVCYAFSSLSSIIASVNGIYYLLLLLNFSSVCDMGAYFVGVTLGKHKLCPEISPKKTVEGAIGGIVSSIIVGIIITLCFSEFDKLIATAIITVPLCALGMIGDLFASSIKRSVNLKDYSDLIPGHGGILDRFDSVLMIAPLLAIFVEFGVI